MSLPRVSVVIPTWNEGPRIAKVLKRIKEQTIPPWEIIVVDKYSTDGTGNYAESTGAKVIYERRSVAIARNVGAKACSGGIVAFTEADVIVPERWVETIVSKFKSPKLLALAGPGYPYDPDGVSASLMAEYRVYNGFRAFTSRLGWFMCSGYNLAVRQGVFDSVQFPDVVPNDDGLFGQAVSRLGQTLFSLELPVRISSRRFRKLGLMGGNLYYTFMFENLFPFLMPLITKRRHVSSRKFQELRK